jgi:hypothetical protein
MGHIENDSSKNSSIVACVFVSEVTFLPRRYLATIGGFLPSRCLARSVYLRLQVIYIEIVNLNVV